MNDTKIKSFTDLNVWKEGHKLVLMVYRITKLFPINLIAKDVGYLNNQNLHELVDQSNLTHKLLQGLITKSKTFIIRKS